MTLPLWDPSPVALGSVGYLLKPEGRFVTLFNAFDPPKTSERTKGMPSLYGYGRLTQASQRQDRRAARGLTAMIQGLLTFKTRHDDEFSYDPGLLMTLSFAYLSLYVPLARQSVDDTPILFGRDREARTSAPR